MLPCFSSFSSGHISFIEDVAAAQPPQHLHYLLKMLPTRGAKQGLIPLVIALSENLFCNCTAAVADSPTRVDQHMHRILVEEDANNFNESNGELFHTASEVGEKLYRRGDFAESRIANFDGYLLKAVPRYLTRHFEQRDHVLAMVTGEFYIKKGLFPGFGRPFVFYAEILQRVGRTSEDAARVALKSPWTLAAGNAHWEGEQIEYIKEKVSEEGRQEDLKKGKAAAQNALDEAAFLLDLASI
ncbi:hypothetical protein Peur_038608 [Populus x canadensis]